MYGVIRKCGDNHAQEESKNRMSNSWWRNLALCGVLLGGGAAAVTAAEPERLNQQVLKLATAGQEFENPRDGWVWLAGEKPFGPDFAVLAADGSISGRAKQVFRGREWIGRLKAGRYTVSGQPAANPLTVHAIPEIYFYAPGISNTPELDGPYGWAELKEPWLAAVTTMSVGHMDWKSLGAFRDHGRRVLNNFSVSDPDQADYPERAVAYIAANRLLTDPFFDGVSMDEYHFTGKVTPLVRQTQLLETLPNPSHRPIYTWIHGVGTAENTPERKAFLTAACTDSNRAMMEVYCATLPTEEAAAADLRKRYPEFMQSVLAIAPESAPHFGIIAGSFNQIPVLTLEHHPDVDFRYYLDMQLQLLAGSPEFRDLGVVGFWGCNYVDEDLQRWGLALLRHYFIEGQREMLSRRYGFTYRLPYLKNADFGAGLEHWQVSAPDPANVFPGDGKARDFAKKSLGVWGTKDKEPMNRFAVLRKNAAGENRIAQKLVHLVPGRKYMLQFVSLNYYELQTGQRRPHLTGLKAEFLPGEVAIDSEAVHVDRNLNRTPEAGRANVHRICFTPKQSEVTLAFTDRDSNGLPGEELGLTFVQVKPRFLPEP